MAIYIVAKQQMIIINESICFKNILQKKYRRKFDEKAVEGIFVGYDLRSKGYRIYTGRREVIVSRTVKFFENMNSESILEDKVEERKSDLIHFNFSAENMDNNNAPQKMYTLQKK